MKAIRLQAYGGPEQLRLEEAPIPPIDAGQALIRVRAASVNPFDFKLASGAFQKMIPLNPPYIPGGDFSGVIEKVSRNVTDFKAGDEVYGNCPRGAYAQFVAVATSTIAPKPAKLTHVEAASIPVAAETAWQALFDHGHLEHGQTVLIHAAAGGVGTFAVQLAHWKGARVLATASAQNAEFVESLGADQVIDYKTIAFESVAQNIDLVLDLLGGETQVRSFAVLRPAGYLISTVSPPDPKLAAKLNVHAAMMSMRPATKLLTKLAGLIDEGVLKTSVARTYALVDAPEAWRQSQSGHTRGKIVLEIPD
jgi:NADPH:quinone reductase-like Zn-dependent oxidoreductase